MAHRISNHLIVEAVERGCVAIGFEDLRLANITRRAKPKRDSLQPQQYLPNSGAAKTALNKALLGRNLARIKEFTKYKCRRAGLCLLRRPRPEPVSSAPPVSTKTHEIAYHKPISMCPLRTSGTCRPDRRHPMSSSKLSRRYGDIARNFKQNARLPARKGHRRRSYEPRNTPKTQGSLWVDYHQGFESGSPRAVLKRLLSQD